MERSQSHEYEADSPTAVVMGSDFYWALYGSAGRPFSHHTSG
jgi:hypothetical protein